MVQSLPLLASSEVHVQGLGGTVSSNFHAMLLLFPVCNTLVPLHQHHPSLISKLDPKLLGSYCFYFSAWFLIDT